MFYVQDGIDARELGQGHASGSHGTVVPVQLAEIARYSGMVASAANLQAMSYFKNYKRTQRPAGVTHRGIQYTLCDVYKYS